jgi:hypothetical protein
VQLTDVVLPGPLYREFKRDPSGPIFQDEKALREYLEEHGLMKEAYIVFVSSSFYERQHPVTKTWRKKISENLAMVLEVARGLRREDGLLAAKVCNVYSQDEVPDDYALYERAAARLRTRYRPRDARRRRMFDPMPLRHRRPDDPGMESAGAVDRCLDAADLGVE